MDMDGHSTLSTPLDDEEIQIVFRDPQAAPDPMDDEVAVRDQPAYGSGREMELFGRALDGEQTRKRAVCPRGTLSH